MQVFQNLFPARGRKQELRPYQQLAIDETVFQNLFPARGRKHQYSGSDRWQRLIGVFQNLFPARGRKPHCTVLRSAEYACPTCFSEPIPRKGTETKPFKISLASLFIEVFQNLFPARGRKLPSTGMELSSYSGEASFSEPIPRKGTETIPSEGSLLWGSGLQVFQNLFPARGRKLLPY